MELRIIEPKNLVVTQANTLAQAAYKMTLQEKRLLLLLVSMIRKDDLGFKRYRIPAIEVINFLGLAGNKDAYNRLRSISRSLLSRVVDIDKGEGEWEQFQWVRKAHYIPKHKSDSGQALLELQVHEDMRPFLLELSKHFASIPFRQIAHLPSYYSIRMFEILYHESYSMTRPYVYLDLEWLKRALGVEDKYPFFGEFRRRVLDKASKDCSTRTPLTFTYTPKTKGKKVLGLHFHVAQNQKGYQLDLGLPDTIKAFELSAISEVDEENPTFKRLIEKFGIKPKQAAALFARYDEKYIHENLNIIESRHHKGAIKNLPAYTLKALSEDYRQQAFEATSPTPYSSAKTPFQEKELIESSEGNPQLIISDQELENVYYQRRNQIISDIIQSQGGLENLVAEFSTQFEVYSTRNPLLRDKQRKTDQTAKEYIQDALVKMYFHQHLLENYAQKGFETFEAWKQHKAA